MMRNIILAVKKQSNLLVNTLPLVAFLIPISVLYLLNPAEPYLGENMHLANSFEIMWKGRTFQLFFVWLIALELILGWENLREHKLKHSVSYRSLLFTIALMLPSLFVVVAHYGGLNLFIWESSQQSGVYWAKDMPVAVEYLVFAALFSLTVFASSGLKGLKNFSVPIFFPLIVGAIFVVDSIYPYDQFTPFQALVPVTTILAANTLGLMGYSTTLDLSHGALPYLTVVDPANPVKPATFAVAWPCAGIESLLIFTVVTLLFLKRMPISWKAKVGYFAVGAAVTYFINILRIVSIYLVALSGGDVNFFHNTYGPMYAIPWIVSYPLIILGTQSLWRRFTNRKKAEPVSEGSKSSQIKPDEMPI